ALHSFPTRRSSDLSNDFFGQIFIIVTTPISTHKLKTSETDDGGVRKIGHKYADETDGFEVLHLTYSAFKFSNRDTQFEPAGVYPLIAHARARRDFIDHKVLSDDHIIRTDGNTVLVIFVGLIHRVVPVGIFAIRQ